MGARLVPDHESGAAGACQAPGQVDAGVEGGGLSPEPGQGVVLPPGPGVAAPRVAGI